MATVRQHRKKLKKKVNIAVRNVDWYNVKVFEDVPDILRLTQDDEGKRIWLADEKQIYAKRIELVEHKGDVLDITYQGEKKYRSTGPNRAILHPNEITKERLEEYGYEIVDGRKN